MVENFGGSQRAVSASACAGNTGQIGEMITDSRLVQPSGLSDDILGVITLIHKIQGLLVAGFGADGNAVKSQLSQLLKLSVGFGGDIRHAGKAAHGLAGGEILANQAGDGCQLVIGEREGIGAAGPAQEDLGAARTAGS